MSRKAVLIPTAPVELAHSLSASFNSTATQVPLHDTICYQINATTSNAIGTFYLQVSIDGSNYIDVGSAGSLASANDNLFVSYTNNGAAYVRIRYLRTSGTGTADIYISARSVGA